MTHTHVGNKSHVGHVHCGHKLYGHRIPKIGVVHALNGGPNRFTALCGEWVHADMLDQWGFPREGGARNIDSVTDADARHPDCKRCLKIIARIA